MAAVAGGGALRRRRAECDPAARLGGVEDRARRVMGGTREAWRPARPLRLVAALAFVAAASHGIALLTGTARAGSVAFALGAVTLTAGVTTLIDYTGRRGMLGNGLWAWSSGDAPKRIVARWKRQPRESPDRTKPS